MRIYIAGPDVFRPDADSWAESIRALLARHGHTALIPLDGNEVTAAGIYRANIAMIRSADAILANLDPFRGDEPDSGTSFEVGFAIALGKPVVGYISNGSDLKDKVSNADCACKFDANGQQIEDFGLPLNLMLSIPCRIVTGDIEAAIAVLQP